LRGRRALLRGKVITHTTRAFLVRLCPGRANDNIQIVESKLQRRRIWRALVRRRRRRSTSSVWLNRRRQQILQPRLIRRRAREARRPRRRFRQRCRPRARHRRRKREMSGRRLKSIFTLARLLRRSILNRLAATRAQRPRAPRPGGPSSHRLVRFVTAVAHPAPENVRARRRPGRRRRPSSLSQKILALAIFLERILERDDGVVHRGRAVCRFDSVRSSRYFFVL
jgi:hypothetical protein